MTMRLHVFFLLLAFCVTSSCARKQDVITTFILIRHAEKASDGTDDPDLKPEGVERANKLVSMFADTPVAAIYATNFKRTRNTVTPLANVRKLTVQNYEAFQAEEIEKMLAEHAGETILICGHSNNIPWIANLLIGKEQYSEYQDNEYGTMLLVSVVKKGTLTSTFRLHY